MKFFFICLWAFSLLKSGGKSVSTTNQSFITTRERLQRNAASGVHPQKEKKIDCKLLHATERTPWVATILNKESGRLICLGSIIDQRHILTAFKCIERRETSTFKILLGYYRAYWGAHSQVIEVEDKYKHEFELVILKLKKDIVFSKRVKPIQLLALKGAPNLRSARLSIGEKEHIGKANSTTNFEKLKRSETSRSVGFFPIFDQVKEFTSEWEITDVLIPGFPVTFTETFGDHIRKSLVYTLREDLIEPSGICKSTFVIPPYIENLKHDPNVNSRYFCVKGISKFCWGCLGAPILDKKTMEQIGVVAKVQNVNYCERKELKYYGIRVDIFNNWIRKNSYYLSH